MPMSTCQLAVFLILYRITINGHVAFREKLIMALTNGNDLKDGDKILETSHRVVNLMCQLVLPGAALVNHLPFCAISKFIPGMLVVPHSYFQCATFPHGSHTSATNHWLG